MGNGQSQRGCFWRLCSCCRKGEDDACPSLLGGDKKNKNKTHEINQTSEVMEYRFMASSDPTSEVPSEYHSETEDATETEEMHSTTGGERGERQTIQPQASQPAIAVDSPSHTGAKWRLIPSKHSKHTHK